MVAATASGAGKQIACSRNAEGVGRSWIVLTEVNVFAWPGPDLRSITGAADGPADYGYLPRRLFRAVRDRFLAKHGDRAIRLVTRTE